MPVARSWIETLGSHGVIAVLLLIVVGAALFTGRESGDLDNESSLAESGELLDIDNGTQVDLPIPPHDLGPTADLSATNQAATPTSDDDVVPPTLSAGLSARTDSAASAGSAADAAGAGQVPSAAASMARQSLARDSYDSGAAGTKDPLVSLDAPQASSAATWQNDQPNLDTGQFSRPQPGEFMTAPANVDVLAAANRTVPDSRDSELPSLEDLTGAHTSHAQSGTALHPGPTPVFSKTPFGVQDWSQYLPRDQPAVAADTEIPSTSNSLQTR